MMIYIAIMTHMNVHKQRMHIQQAQYDQARPSGSFQPKKNLAQIKSIKTKTAKTKSVGETKINGKHPTISR